eukprot:2943825-Rhodomonas_salina.3
MGALGLSGSKALQAVGTMSGGEKARCLSVSSVCLGRVFHGSYVFLVSILCGLWVSPCLRVDLRWCGSALSLAHRDARGLSGRVEYVCSGTFHARYTPVHVCAMRCAVPHNLLILDEPSNHLVLKPLLSKINEERSAFLVTNDTEETPDTCTDTAYLLSLAYELPDTETAYPVLNLRTESPYMLRCAYDLRYVRC